MESEKTKTQWWLVKRSQAEQQENGHHVLCWESRDKGTCSALSLTYITNARKGSDMQDPGAYVGPPQFRSEIYVCVGEEKGSKKMSESNHGITECSSDATLNRMSFSFTSQYHRCYDGIRQPLQFSKDRECHEEMTRLISRSFKGCRNGQK